MEGSTCCPGLDPWPELKRLGLMSNRAAIVNQESPRFPVVPGEVIRPVGRGYALIVEKVYVRSRRHAEAWGVRIDYSEERGCTNTRREKMHQMYLWFWGGKLYTGEAAGGYRQPKKSREVLKDYIRRPGEESQLELFAYNGGL